MTNTILLCEVTEEAAGKDEEVVSTTWQGVGGDSGVRGLREALGEMEQIPNASAKMTCYGFAA